MLESSIDEQSKDLTVAACPTTRRRVVVNFQFTMTLKIEKDSSRSLS